MKKNRVLALLWIFFLIVFQLKTGGYLANLMTVFTVVIFLLSVLLMLLRRGLALELEVGNDVGKGENIGIGLTVRTNSGLSMGWLELKLKIENVISGEQRTEALLIPIGLGKTYETELTVSDLYVGEVRVSAEALRFLDLFKLVSRRVNAQAQGSSIIRPNMVPVPSDKDTLYGYDMESYVYSGSKKGSDPSETFGIREYLPGDNPKTIHWKLTSKMDELMVRELGLPIDNKVLIILNNRELTHDRLEAKQRDAVVELFFGIAQGIVDQGLGFSVGWYNNEKGEFLQRPIENKADIYGMMREVLSAPFYADSVSVAQRFLIGAAQRNFASYVYVTAYEDVETHRLEQYGAVNIRRTEEEI